MRKLFSPVAGILSLLMMASCSDKFDIAAPYKTVTVVYGMLSKSDTAHYVRIEKVFMDQNKSAVDMSKVSDSNFFPENQLIVKVKEISNNTVVNTITLNRVDLNNEGYPKNTGTFFSDVNWAYKFKNALNPNYRYRLVITNTATGEVDSAETAVINDDPGIFIVYNFSSASSSAIPVSFSHTRNSDRYTLSGKVDDNVKIIEGVIRFHYVDKNQSTGQETDRYVDWPFANTVITSNSFNLQAQNSSFYTFLSGAMGPAPTNVARYMDSCDIFLYAGSNDFYTYQLVTQAQQGGLTSDQIKPNYTNLKGTNVLGLFTSRGKRMEYNIPIPRETLDSLKVNPTTQSLNIQQDPADH